MSVQHEQTAVRGANSDRESIECVMLQAKERCFTKYINLLKANTLLTTLCMMLTRLHRWKIRQDQSRSHVYADLHSRGYFIGPGETYGGDFSIYNVSDVM